MAVTGGAGFIGSNLVDSLVARGDDVVVIDDLSFGKREFVNGAATLVERDIRDGVELAGTDVVFHLAAQTDVQTSVRDPARDADVNVRGTVKVLEAATARGRPSGLHLHRRRDLRRVRRPPPRSRHARSPARPTGSRSSAERSTWRASTGSTAPLTWSAASGTSSGRGSRRASRAASSPCSSTAWRRGEQTAIFGDGLQVRDFVFVGDVVEALIAAAGHEGGVFNVGTGIPDDGARAAPHLRRGRRRRRRADVRAGTPGRPAPLRARRLARASGARLPRPDASRRGHYANLGLDRPARSAGLGARPAKRRAVDAPFLTPHELVRPWRRATFVAGAVAVVELVLLLGAATMLLAKPVPT